MAEQVINEDVVDSRVIDKLPAEYAPYIKFILNELVERKLKEIEILYRTEGTDFSEYGICSLVLPEIKDHFQKAEKLETGYDGSDPPRFVPYDDLGEDIPF